MHVCMYVARFNLINCRIAVPRYVAVTPAPGKMHQLTIKPSVSNMPFPILL